MTAGSFDAGVRRWRRLTGYPSISFPSRCSSCGFPIRLEHKVSVRERKGLLPLVRHQECVTQESR